jgi:Ser/Thr protein kinase RdoA (MazF antagonist)
MMKLSVMLRVDGVIDDEGRSRVAERMLEQWAHEPGSERFFRSSANFVYSFRRGDERCFLRFAERGERSAEEIEAELALLRWLASQGMRVAAPIASDRGRWVETVETDLGTFHAVVFTALHGAQPEVDELSAAQFEQWGATLGQLHATMRQFHDSQAIAARRACADALALARAAASHDEPCVQTECEQLSAWLAALPATATNYGLIHGDFELDNLFWQDDGTDIAMLDFDECSHCRYVADIAFALRDLFENGVDLSSPSFGAFMRGYARHVAVDEDLLAQLPTWMRLVNLIMYGKLMRAMDVTPGPDDPEWAVPLVARLRQRMDDYKASL